MDVEQGDQTAAPASAAQPTQATDGATQNSAEQPVVKASTRVQIKALIKKNMKVHMRTNAMPCCGCGLVNACCLHVCCPIFFVLIVTLVPLVVVKGSMNSKDAEEFLETRIIPGESMKLWPAWPAGEFTNSKQRCEWYAHPMYQDKEFDLCPNIFAFGVRPLVDHIFHHKADEGTDQMRGRGGKEIAVIWPKTCFCATLALVGPDSVVDTFRTFLQAQQAEWKANYLNRRTMEVVKDLNTLSARLETRRLQNAGGAGNGTSPGQGGMGDKDFN